MEKHLEALIGRRLYDLIRSKTRGYITVEIKGDTLDIGVKWKSFEYGTYYENLSSAIMSGDFSCEKVANRFIADWKHYIHRCVEEAVFYSTSEWYKTL